MVETNHDEITRILGEVAAFEDVEILDLPPLGMAVDTDALQKLLESSEEVRVEFKYAGNEVRVTDEEVLVQAT